MQDTLGKGSLGDEHLQDGGNPQANKRRRKITKVIIDYYIWWFAADIVIVIKGRGKSINALTMSNNAKS